MRVRSKNMKRKVGGKGRVGNDRGGTDRYTRTKEERAKHGTTEVGKTGI